MKPRRGTGGTYPRHHFKEERMTSKEKSVLQYGWLMFLKGYQENGGSVSEAQTRDHLFETFILDQDTKFICESRESIEA